MAERTTGKTEPVSIVLSDREMQFLGVTPEQITALTTRLQTFVETSAENWGRHPTRDEEDQDLKTLYKKWEDFLGIIPPSELPNDGVGQTFLVVWNNVGGSLPMEIWLAKGKNVSGANKYEYLNVDYVSLGTLHGGTQEIGNEPTGNAKSGSHTIYIDSAVILSQ